MAKKKKNADFQKVKLRVGRQLPKGLNVTDTSFSTRKIVLREQVKDQSFRPTSHRKLNIKELLSRLDHYSSSTRLDALVGLKELLHSNPELIKSNLSFILEKSCQLIIDKDVEVRKVMLRVLELVLRDVDSKGLFPFFPILSSYVCCAMTHIVTSIRYDSLLFLDLLLETFPDLTVMSGNQIFQNFLDQISNVRDSQSVKIGRLLHVNPNEKLTSQKWRTNVLRRMIKFLRTSIDQWNPTEKENLPGRVVLWDCNNPSGITLYFGNGSTPYLSDKFSLDDFNTSSERTVQIKDPHVLKKFISVLIPLLIETWVEASPSSMLSLYQNTDDDPYNTMDSVLQVTKLLGECTEISGNESMVDWFNHLFANDFKKHFMAWFPYTPNKSPSRKKRKHGHQEVTVSHVQLNLAVCEIFSLLTQQEELEGEEHCRQVCRYLYQALIDEELCGVADVTSVVRIVRRLLWFKEVAEELLGALWWLCRHWHHGRKDRTLIVDFFVDLVCGIHHRDLFEGKAISAWLQSLPKEMVLMASSPSRLGPLLSKVSRFAARGYLPFLQGLQENDTDLIALLAGKLETEASGHVAVLCALLPKFSLSTFRTLAETVRNPGTSVKDVIFLCQNLCLRFLHKSEPGFEASHYLGFLLCVLIGVFKHEGSLLQQHYQSNADWCHLRQFLPSVTHFVVVPSDSETFERHSGIIESFLKIILQFPDMNYLEKSIYTYVNTLLDSASHLPVHSVIGILRLTWMVHENSTMEDDDSIGPLLETLHVTLVDLSLAALCTCSCLRVLSMDGRMAEDLLDAVVGFLQFSGCKQLICEHLYQKLHAQVSFNSEEAECLGGVIMYLLQLEIVEPKSMKTVSLILKKFQAQIEMTGLEIWFKDLLYEFQDHCQRTLL